MLNSYFSVNQIQPIQLFSTTHQAALAVIAGACLALFVARRRLREEKLNVVFRHTFAFFILLLALSYQIWSVAVREWSVFYSLPLQLCDISVILSAVMLFNKNNSIFEITYIWGLGGAFQALLTPNLWYAFPHFIFFQFFLAHGSIILACLFMIFVDGLRPRPGSLKRVVLVTNGYALVIAIFNFYTGSNYLFLCRKPDLPSLLDFLGPWPWYILSLELVLIFMFFLYNLPFFICRLLRKE
ncbi:MAG: hypothetical protein JL50_00010 [Peptococcaceae bacterium BICA1-7]|nr:MAG: hypothetical protein JL50_00010 [Peptococcaceae bacterium BICA1-7]HBV98234.1 TIGR02206 family membrane protein [Desulfotomaculum sp.]